MLSHLHANAGVDLRAAVRRDVSDLGKAVEQSRIDELGPNTNWGDTLQGVDVIVHAAARVHVMRDNEKDPLAAFRRTNVDGTMALASQAARAGVQRFVFISSIKVNGDGTPPECPYTSESYPRPVDPYGVSKLEAELALREVERQSGMEVVILRPPLVYGPGVKANFLSLMRLVDRGVPLPFGSIENRRSLLYIGNLVSAVEQCLTHERAAGRTYLLADRESVSTGDLVRIVAHGLGRPARLLPLPEPMLRFTGAMIGRRDMMNRLIGSLVVDCAPISFELGWTPPYSLEEGIESTARWYERTRGRP